MSLLQLLQSSALWLAYAGLALTLVTLISFIVGWGAKFRLVGATIFTFLLSVSSWAFTASYTPPVIIEGAKYAPVVFDNGYDLVVASVPEDFPNDAIQPTLEQIAGNLKGGGRNGATVHVRLRTIEPIEAGISSPKILGEVMRDLRNNLTIPSTQTINGK